jgi:hypothetical protein
MGEELRGGWHGFRRTVLTAAAAGVVTVAALAIAASGAAADSSSSSWVPGEAKGIAQALAVAPTTAGLGYNVILGTSVADYQVQEGQAESKTFDGGAIVLAATSTQCDGSAPPITQSQLPQAAVAETTNGAQTTTDTINAQYANGQVPQAALGSEYASVTTQPTATAITKSADIDIPGAIEILGVESSALAQQVVGQYRQATTPTDLGELELAGVVDLKGLHFEDTQETGPDGSVTKQAASFSVASALIGGQPQSVAADQLSTLFQVANTALEGTGFHISLPTTTTLDDGQLNLNPLSIGIDNSALGQEIVGPVLGQVQPLRDQLDQVLLTDISCKVGTPLTVADIGLGVLSGGGNLDLQLGYLQSVSDGNSYANPFGTCLLSCGSVSLGQGAGPAPGTDLGATGSPGTPATPAVPGTGGSGGTRALGKVTRTVECMSTSLAGHFGCSNGDAVPVGIIGLAAVLGVGAADYARLRRYRRVVPQETVT